MNCEICFEGFLFQWEWIVLWVEKFLIYKRVKGNGVVILHQFGYKEFDLLRQLKFMAVFLEAEK